VWAHFADPERADGSGIFMIVEILAGSRLATKLPREPMHTATSKDGTAIAFDRIGDGPAVILVGGAFSYRAFPKMVQLAELLSERFTVINYDRRGRGDSGDTAPYSVEHEIEDLAALVDGAGGAASVWGWSSGGVLALRAAASGVPFEKLAVYEPPFLVDDSGHLPPADFASRLEEIIASGRRGQAVKYYMTKGMGVPALFVAAMRLMPSWSSLKAVAHTLPYDWAVLGDAVEGKPLSREDWEAVTAPTLVIAGEKSPEQLRAAALALVDVLPRARHRVLKGQSHNVSMERLAPVLEDYFADGPSTLLASLRRRTPDRKAS
jgi:pimeloyl-ACP methyl ester carboxylesterase